MNDNKNDTSKEAMRFNRLQSRKLIRIEMYN